VTPTGTLGVALVTDVFHRPDSADRLLARLREARDMGADLAVLPELPLNDWCAVRRTLDEADAERPNGRRQTIQAEAAREAGVALLGGAILADPVSGRRRNTALLYNASGEVVYRYAKIHLPYEEGFWEADHYEPGEELARPVELEGFPLGIQICSDVNRPEPSHILGAMGALVLLAPRATPPASWERWRAVLRSNAVTSGLYVVSVNRPPEEDTPVGGPSIAIGPDGEVLLETTEPVRVVTLRRGVVEAARGAYPGYLAVRGDLYARGWAEVAAAARPRTFQAPPPRTRDSARPRSGSIDTNPRQN
jgi:predicted amidohydrolase